MTKKESWLLALACMFFGVVLGFFIAPMKNGMTVSCGNNNRVYREGRMRAENKEQ